MCAVWPLHSRWLREYSNEPVSNFALSLNTPPRKHFRWFRRPQLWATGDWQLHHDNTPAHASRLVQSFFGETSNHPGVSASPQQLLAFPKTKITFEREEIWLSMRFRKICGAADGDWENCVRSQLAYFEGDWGVIVLCTMFLVSSSTNVSVFHITWLDTFWTDLVFYQASYSLKYTWLFYWIYGWWNQTLMRYLYLSSHKDIQNNEIINVLVQRIYLAQSSWAKTYAPTPPSLDWWWCFTNPGEMCCWLIFTMHELCAGHYKTLRALCLFSPLILSIALWDTCSYLLPFYRWGNWGSEKLSHSPSLPACKWYSQDLNPGGLTFRVYRLNHYLTLPLL